MRRTRAFFATAALACFQSPALAAPAAERLALTHLETQAAGEPLGIAEPAPRLSWAMVSAERGVRQRAFRVLVASRPELVRDGKADIHLGFHAGRVP